MAVSGLIVRSLGGVSGATQIALLVLHGLMPGISLGSAPRTMGIVQICLTDIVANNRVPVRYVDWGTEQSVPVETVGAVTTSVVPCVESTDANAVPVSEVVPA